MRSRKLFTVAAALIASLALAVPALAGAPKPCSLITKLEAEAILGEAVKAPRTGKVVGMASGEKCVYYTAAPLAKRGRTGVVRLLIFSKDSLKGGIFSTPEDYFKRLSRAGKNAGSQIEVVAGLGDKAYWSPRGDTLHILAKGLYLQFKLVDMKVIKVKGGMDKLHAAVSEHRKKLSIDAAKKYIMPKL